MSRPLAATAVLAVLLTGACADNSSAPETTTPDVAANHDGHHGPRRPRLTPQTSGTTNRLQAISPVNEWVVWASGVNGTYARTLNGGRTWEVGVVPGAETLQFRDVEGISAREAYLMAAGSGTDSRIYKTRDGGRTWTLQFQNEDPNAFYDCFAFWTPNRGITFSDAVNGRFPVIATRDGRTWQDIGDRLPAAQAGEAGFAASGTCTAVQGGQRAWIATGGAEKARILATTDGGRSWNSYDTPIVQGTPSSGGTGGEPFVGPCGDLNGNLIDDCQETLVQNSRFDSDARGWLVDPKVQQVWSTTNATGAAGSGSVSLINTNVVPGLSGTTTGGSRQCLAGFGKEVFEFAARVFLKEGQGQGRAAISVATYGHDNCQGTFLETFTVGPAVTLGSWQVIQGDVKMPAAARSFWVRLVVSKPLAEPSFEALMDDVLVAKRK